jgi:phosphoserine phosphatase RsbU/P
MLSNKSVVKLSVVLGVVCWVSLLVIDLIVLFGGINNIEPSIPAYIPKLILNAFFLILFIFYKFFIGKAESVNFVDLLWRVFVVGLITALVSLGIRFFIYALAGTKFSQNPLLISFFYHVNIGLVSTFLLSTFIVWKHLILYHKSKYLRKGWNIFEYTLLVSILFNLFNYGLFDRIFNAALSVLVIMGMILSINLKWIAYLNVKQKWKSILLLLFTIIYLSYFFTTLFNYSVNYQLAHDLLNNVFILALFIFTILYAVFSLLVILFNLPTSSVFEQKLEEVINFQRLSQSSQSGRKEDQVYDILLESSISAVLADAAWLEILDKFGNTNILLTKNIKEKEVAEIKTASRNLKQKSPNIREKKIGPSKLSQSLNGSIYKSALTYPLTIQNEEIGSLVLLKEVEDGFTKEMIDIINSFGSQACISIENFRLISEALDNERYKEELKIAKRVQRSLLPKKTILNESFDLSAFSEAADEVGGDYYDIFKINDQKVALIIGDVSGKGTSAAFNMSQMKGVFHSLVQLNLSAKDFLVNANNALSSCLEKTSFITISYFILDIKDRSIEFARAGHCPTLFFDTSVQEVKFFQNKGLGLGILRNSNYHKYVEVNKVYFKKGDILMLYTDGITEAKNPLNEEYGYERLQKLLFENKDKEPKEIETAVINSLFEFCGQQPLNDDYTVVIVKFK